MTSHANSTIASHQAPARPWVVRASDPWFVFYALVLTAWVGLAVLANSHGTGHVDMTLRGHAAMTAMWAVMSIAMMAPTAVPLLRTYRGLTDRPIVDRARLSFHALTAGYLTVWIGFSVAAASGQHAVAHAGLLTASGTSASTWLTITLLFAAGAYQLSPLKAACLDECQAPMTYFLTRWRNGPRGAFEMGLRHGVTCVGCCWALMLLAFVGGAMNLLWMGAATILMTAEKLDAGRRLSSAIGAGLIAAAALVGVAAL